MELRRLQWLDAVFAEDPARPFLYWRGDAWSYGWLRQAMRGCSKALDDHGVASGEVVSLDGDYSPGAIAQLLALIDCGCIAVPLSAAARLQREEFLEIAEVQHSIRMADDDKYSIETRERTPANALLRRLAAENDPGLVVFSSGSTGKSKAALHNFRLLLEKFKVRRRSFRTITFLMLDHLGGINTLLYVLSNGGAAIALSSRDPEEVCALIEKYGVELFPTSPTFLNLLLISEAWRNHDLSSLKRVTYGTEVMPESLLRRIHEILPGVELQQTYGLSELGVLRSKSRDSSSLWMKVGGEGYETRVKDATLWIRARSAMLGYLNAASPFDEEGWFNTGDEVEVDGDYLRILGRKSEIINVGGEKVYPAEVEAALLTMPNVAEVSVTGEPSPFTGNSVTARFNLREPEEPAVFRQRVRAFCMGKLAPYKTPTKILIVHGNQYSERFKKMRRAGEPGS
jgi:acyl-CoA synthetase (AMP-forming)/AMP-acid ligase II